MDDIQEARVGAVNCATTSCLGDCGVRAKSQRKSPTINPLAIEASLQNVFVVTKTTTPQSTVKVLQCPMGLCIRPVGPIAGANGRKGRSLVMNQTGDLVTCQCREKDRRHRGWQRFIGKLWQLDGRGVGNRRGWCRGGRNRRGRCRLLWHVRTGKWKMREDDPDVIAPWCEPEGPNAQSDRPQEGIEAGHNAAKKATQTSQVTRKTEGSRRTCQLSRPRPGSTRACQYPSSPRTHNRTGKDAPGDCRGEPEGWEHGGHGG